jgi:hypothetical protein
MATFTHDPDRLHPPTLLTSLQREPLVTPRDAPVPGPFTQQTYNVDPALVSMALGAVGEPHRIVYVNVPDRTKRGQGHMRALLTQVMADLDADHMACTTVIRNYEPDCDPERLSGLFADFGFTVDLTDPDPEIEMIREAR